MWALFCINPRTRLSCQHRRVFMSASERDRVEDLSSRVLLRMPIYQPECGRWPGLSCSTSSACQNHHRWSSFQLHSSSVQMPLWMPSSLSGTFRLHAGVGERAGRKGGCPKLISKVRGVSELFASKYLRVWSTKCQLEREVREKKTARKKKEEGKRWEKGDKWGVNKRDEGWKRRNHFLTSSGRIVSCTHHSDAGQRWSSGAAYHEESPHNPPPQPPSVAASQ